MATVSTTGSPSSLEATLKAAAARAPDGDYKTRGDSHTVKDSDGDYKADTPAADPGPAPSEKAVIAGTLASSASRHGRV